MDRFRCPAVARTRDNSTGRRCGGHQGGPVPSKVVNYGEAMSEILACIDFSDASVAVLAEAARLATDTQHSIHVIHVAAEEPEIAGYDTGPVAAHTRDDRALELLDEHHRLREIAESLQENGLDVVPLLVMGQTVEKILDEAERLDASTIVIGSHGHGRLHHLLLGSVSEGVLRHTTRPVVVVPVAER